MNVKKTALFVLVLVMISVSCSLFTPNNSAKNSNTSKVDFKTPAEPLNVTVTLDDSFTTSDTISPDGGSLSLTAADGSIYNLEIPANALDGDTLITMTAVKSLDGAPLDSGDVAAVQLEPSGLFFKEMLTLTITPAKEIPIKNQVIFGYEGDGQDYHLAVVDPKSKEIKIKLMQFSGAGVGSASDSAWAANLIVQASEASTRLLQKLGEYTQAERQASMLGELESDANSDNIKNAIATLDQFDDQVILKEIAAAELDCKYAGQAIKDLLLLEKVRQLLGYEQGTNNFTEKALKLAKIAAGCQTSYQVIETPGLGRTWTGACIDDLAKPFSLAFTAPEQTVSLSFSPVSSTRGSLIEKWHADGSGGTMDYTGSGNYEIIPDNKDAEGNVIGMEIAFSTAGNSITCAGSECVTNKMDSGKGVGIPLRVQDGACP